jgi:hypothetical protein
LYCGFNLNRNALLLAADLVVAAKGAQDHRRGATHPGFHAHRAGGAVHGAGSAFHAGIMVLASYFAIIQEQYLMGAHRQARLAANALVLIKNQSTHIL